MEYVILAVVLLGAGWFLYNKITKKKITGSGGGGRDDDQPGNGPGLDRPVD